MKEMIMEIFATVPIQVSLGVVGGLVAQVLNLVELQNIPKERRPDFKDLFYWLPFIIWPFLGGVITYIYNDPALPLNKLVAFHLGLSSPLVLRTMASAIPAQARQQPPGA